jgi:ABC-type uncharacterized transport system involved in gliding motility auxiliary subunit
VALRRREALEAREGVDFVRAARRSAGSAVYVAAVVAALAVVIGISARHRVAWDATRFAANTFSPQTLEVVRGLERPVRIVALFTDSHPERQGYWERLQNLKRESDALSVEFVDPVAQPGAVRSLGLEAGEFGSRRDGVTVVLRDDRRIVIRDTKEESLTNAILEVGSGDKRVVGIVLGYGGLDPESTADRGLSKFVEALRAEYYDVVGVRLAAGVPPAVNALLLPGPETRIPEEDLSALATWMESGGRLLALLDPGAGEASGIQDVLARYGLRADDRQVLEPQSTYNRNGNSEFVRAVDYTAHEIVRGFGSNLPTEYPIVSSVEHFEPGDPTVFHDALVRSSRVSVGLQPDGTRDQGPFDLAAASWKRLPAGPGGVEREIRVVLFGDADFAVNAYLSLGANRNVILNAVGWLTQARGLVTIRRMPLEGQTIAVTAGEDRWIRLAVFAAPLLVLLTGVMVLLRRRGL